MSRRVEAYFQGCLLAGAVGDALGAPVEFMSIDRIRSEFGETGLTDYAEAYGRLGAITDDTQMTLFTAEGLILSKVRQEYAGDQGIIDAGYHALLRWLYTQEMTIQEHLIQNYGTCSIVDGVLTGHKALFSLRAPGNSCLSSLKSGKMGTMGDAVNDSKGCGGVMRMAPAGLMFDDPEKAFHFGCRLAALTHGHPTGFLAAGTFSAIISLILSGAPLVEAIEESVRILKSYKGHQETQRAIGDAVDVVGKQPPEPETIENLGAGWIAEEALAISLFCSLTAQDDFEKGLLLSVNHSGDSDSTGSITGNIMGALYGLDSVPERWLAPLELRSLITDTAMDLFEHLDT